MQKDLGLMDRFADPVLFAELTSVEKLEGGLVTTLMGIGTTFIMLVLIWGVISLMSRILQRVDKSVASKSEHDTADLKAVSSPSPVAETVAADRGLDLIAVLIGAIAASEGSESISNLRIKKISRIAGDRPAWGNAGTADSIESRRF